MNHFSLFTGIGGIDLAADMVGFTTVGQCEYADFPTKVLEKHWPNVPRWRDVRDVTAESIRAAGIERIDLLSGGFPCQPHSLAGKRKASSDERDLWGEFARIICETHPRWVLGENVPGLLSSEDGRFFGRILGDLAQMGYRVGWASYGANVVGANHERERVFIIAYSGGKRLQRSAEEQIQRISDIQIKLSGSNTDRSGRWDLSKSRVCGVGNGIPNRLDRTKSLGNAVVPQQIYPVLKAIREVEYGD